MSSRSSSASVSGRLIFAGTPATSMRGGTTKPSGTTAPAATSAHSPTTAPSRTREPMPMSAPFFTVQPCTMAACPIVTSSATTQGCTPPVTWRTQLSCTFEREPILMKWTSPRTTTPNHSETSLPISTSPVTSPSSARKTPCPTRGFFPSNSRSNIAARTLQFPDAQHNRVPPPRARSLARGSVQRRDLRLRHLAARRVARGAEELRRDDERAARFPAVRLLLLHLHRHLVRAPRVLQALRHARPDDDGRQHRPSLRRALLRLSAEVHVAAHRPRRTRCPDASADRGAVHDLRHRLRGGVLAAGGDVRPRLREARGARAERSRDHRHAREHLRQLLHGVVRRAVARPGLRRAAVRRPGLLFDRHPEDDRAVDVRREAAEDRAAAHCGRGVGRHSFHVHAHHHTAQIVAIEATPIVAAAAPKWSAAMPARSDDSAVVSVAKPQSAAKTRPRIQSGVSRCRPNVDVCHCAPPPRCATRMAAAPAHSVVVKPRTM